MIKLQVDGTEQDFIEIKPYRAKHNLPETFAVSTFEPKSYEGLGSIDKAGHALVTLRQELLCKMPHFNTTHEWLDYHPSLQQLFRDELAAINPHVKLREVEIDFAAAGFGDALNEWIYALIYADAAHHTVKPFHVVYREWLYGTVRVTQTAHPYEHQAKTWHVQLITHAYGRVGMMVKRGDATDYVYDNRLACPAEGYMVTLLQDVAAQIQADCSKDKEP